MNPALGHARAMLRLLHPSMGTARPAWVGLSIGAMGLLLASRQMFSVELGDRLVGALFLVFTAAGLSLVRQVAWTPNRAELAPLPVPRRTLGNVEAAVYLALISLMATLPASLLAALRFQLLTVVLEAPQPMWPNLLAGMAGLAIAIVMLVPLLAAVAPHETRYGPLALLRLLVPWLPVGIAAPAGWLQSWTGMLATVMAMGAASAVLLALRHTGWEDWWPTLPSLEGTETRARPALPHAARLATDLREGLTRGLGFALPLTALGWLVYVAAVRRWLPDEAGVPAVLLLTAAFTAPIWTGLRIPGAARFPGWQPHSLPWQLLPVRSGDIQLKLFESTAAGWLVLAPLNLAALLALYLTQGGSGLDLAVAEVVIGLLLMTIPALAAWEGRFINTLRPPPKHAMGLLVLSGIASFWLVVAGSRAVMAGLPEVPLGSSDALVHALHRLIATEGPAFLIGLALLATGRLLLLRDIARQR